ncbi:MAG: MarR family transcriptional regulator [Methanomicrobiales archaeon]|nr:MarR family transcriptional regulator [Methanomicrobiales archaeon]MDD1679730.1 MarR family transcriptional regulator [Methanomicrobiales archaeon]
MASVEEEALRIIQCTPGGVLQSELWKILKIDSRKCSRVVKKLLDMGLIERVEHRSDGIKTFILRGKKKTVDACLLLAEQELVPCIACDRECIVEECNLIVDWMYQLAIEEAKK